jgi:putative flippase GtrA
MVTASPTREEPAPGLVRTLYRRIRRVIGEVGKFGVVGAICYGIDVGTYALCLTRFNTFVALAVSTAVSTTCAFVGNRWWTWRDAAPSSLHRQYGLYFGFNLVGLAIGLVCLYLSHTVLGGIWPVLRTPAADIVAGKVLGVGLASLFRFWAYRRFVFGTAVPPE